MTVLVAYDCATSEIRRYDSGLRHGVTHEAGVEGFLYKGETIEAFRCTPSMSLATERHAAWTKFDGRRTKWEPSARHTNF